MLMFSESARGNPVPVFVALGLVEWLTMARVVRGQVLSLREREFVLAARALGAPASRVLGRHVLPNAMPVVVAAVRSLCDPAFAYHGPASSTGGSAMVLVVNGPIATRLGVNNGNNLFGQGHRPNATIGRAVRLIMMNTMNTRPGFLDRATLGNPGKYSFCFAEHEDEHPWEPLHVSRGLARHESAVTLIASNSLYQVYNQLAATPAPLLLCFADALGNMGAPNLKGFNQTLIVFAGEHADILKAAGWSRADVQRFLVEHTRRRLADFKRTARVPGAVAETDETTWRHVFEHPDDILIVCAGGRAGSWSACLPGWGNKWTRAVTTRIDEVVAPRGRQA